jgi:hypothetical protein
MTGVQRYTFLFRHLSRLLESLSSVNIVMIGLVPAIHVFLAAQCRQVDTLQLGHTEWRSLEEPSRKHPAWDNEPGHDAMSVGRAQAHAAPFSFLLHSL